MKNFFSKKPLIFFVLMFFCFNVFLFSAQANIFGEIQTQLNNFNTGAQLTKAPDPIGVIINIINLSLTFLGLIFIVLILYGGFMYMTAGGDSKRTEKATGILKDSVIGVAIIFASYILVNYVIETVIELFQ